MAQQGWTAGPAPDTSAWTPGAAVPNFTTTNATDAAGNPLVSGLSKAWDIANTTLLPQIADAAHAIAKHIDAPALDRSETMAQIRGFLAGSTEGAGNVVASFASPIGLALTLAGLGSEGALARNIPALKTLLELPQVRTLQRAVQGAGGVAFGAHGATRVATAPTLGEKAQGVAEIAAGAAGAASAMRRPSAPGAPARSGLFTNSNPEEAAAVAFGQQRGIPVDAGTATGNSAVKGAQWMADRTLAGSLVARGANQRTGQALERVGGELATDARGVAVSPEQAGQGIRDALNSKLQAHTDLADHSYEQLRQLEADPRNQRMVPTKPKAVTTQADTGAVDAGGQPITQSVTQPGAAMERMGLPVDTRAAKTALRPVYEQMMRQMPVAQREASPGLQALGNILDGPDYAPLSQVDRDLSAIKAIARKQGGLAKLAAGTLDRAVKQAAANGSPEVMPALETGRRATISKVQTEDLIGALPGGKMEEPLAVFKRATAAQDSGVEFLRTVKEHTPQAIPQIARAKLDELLSTATAGGGFQHTDKLYAEWRRLGSETKRILFPSPGQAQALDHFFLLAKKLNENMNPSGTGQAVMRLSEGGAAVANPVAFVVSETGAAGLSAILHSKAGVNALTRVMVLKAPSAAKLQTAAQRAGWAEVMAAARSVGVPLAVPAAAGSEQTARQK